MDENGKCFELLAAQSAAGKTVKDGAAAIGCSELVDFEPRHSTQRLAKSQQQRR